MCKINEPRQRRKDSFAAGAAHSALVKNHGLQPWLRSYAALRLGNRQNSLHTMLSTLTTLGISVRSHAQPASSEPVGKVNNHSHHEPEPEADPGNPRQTEHQINARSNAEQRKHRRPRDAKCAAALRLPASQDQDSDANENKREEGADIGQINHLVDAREHGADADGNSRQYRRDMRSLKSGMHLCEGLRQQTIARHRKE